MNKLCIIGASGHGKVVADAAELMGQWNEIVFYDDKWPEKSMNGIWKVVGTIKTFLEEHSKAQNVIIAVGDNKTRSKFSSAFRKSGCNLVTVVHPSAVISKYAEIGSGSVIFAGAIVNAYAKIGTDVIINTSASIDHDCLIGDMVHVSPGVRLSGNVTIGKHSWIGVGSCVRQGIVIGDNVVVGGGAVVVSDLEDNIVAFGNPAKKHERN